MNFPKISQIVSAAIFLCTALDLLLPILQIPAMLLSGVSFLGTTFYIRVNNKPK